MARTEWIGLSLYTTTTTAPQWYRGREQRSMGKYFAGGDRTNPVLIGISIFATFCLVPRRLLGLANEIADNPFSVDFSPCH